jgi:site-specific DNA recombinase
MPRPPACHPADGEHQPSPPPVRLDGSGYHIDTGTHKLIPHPGEAPHLREIFRLYVEERLGTRAIADELNRRGVRSRTGHPWSGYTIARIIANPAYAGDIAYGDVYVEGAHGPLISRKIWQKACAIAAARASDHSQHACSPGDYHLTGLITCPACGHKYIGTSATGRTRTYRYYTCFSRVRYGTHGCRAARLPADDTDTAVLNALCDFYSNCTDLIAEAVARARERHRDGHADRRAEHAAILAQIRQKEAAIDRYFTAFENQTMDEESAGDRVKKLRSEIAQLTARAEELADAMGSEPAAPPPGTIERLQAYLADAITSGSANELKAAIEALIAEIRITEEGVIPVFRIPGPRTPIPGGDGAATITGTEPVRAMVRSVGPVGLEPTLSET